MKVGDYVRTKNGYIGKIYNINEFREPSMMYAIDIPKTDDFIFMGEEDFISSPNIIDLIEENDFVEIEYYSNRYKKRVSRIFEVDFINKNRDVCFENGYCRLNMFYGEWSNQDKLLNPIIKSIVTKEQFESMEYKVKE